MKKAAFILISFLCNGAIGDVCDYRPSALVGDVTTVISGAGAGGAAVAGTGMKAVGLYTATNATTGGVMLGSTAAGSSAAGTTGFIAGTSGWIGSTAAFLMNPITIFVGTTVAVGIVGVEGYCYFTKEEDTKEED